MKMQEREVEHFVELIGNILDRPGMYEVNNIEDLSLFISGYKMATSTRGAITSLMGSFRSYLNEKFNTNEDVDWPRLIRYHSGGDQNSLKLFSKYFLAFVNNDGNVL